MKIKIIVLFLFIMAGANLVKATPFHQIFDKAAFYEVMKSGRIVEINTQLGILDAALITEKDAYVGALLMKKAGLVKKPKEKLDLFRTGRIKLETALLSDNSNVEYHFLRLSIQEHAPKIVKYSDQLEKDSQYIKRFFKKFSPLVQQVIIDYSKTSKILRLQDF